MEKGEAKRFRVPALAVETLGVSCRSSSDEATWQEIFSKLNLKVGAYLAAIDPLFSLSLRLVSFSPELEHDGH